MRIESVELFYLSMPEVLNIGDGSQDALLVRVRAGEWTGWGECEAAPLPSIAAFVCPMSHSACKPVSASVIGQNLDGVADIRRIGDLVRAESLDLPQADHTLSGIDMALWDLWGRREGTPVWRLLGYKRAYPKLPYASMLFGDTPEETYAKARNAGFRAAKFGWGPIGRGTVSADAAQFRAAREGLGPDGVLLVDIGTAWGENVERASLALPALNECGALWLEEPFVSGALGAYAALASGLGRVKLAAGEGSHNIHMARHLVDHAGIGFLQIDAGRIGGVSVAKDAADYAAARGVTYVNHTFTSHLALSASLAPYAGLERDEICEYPVEPKALARAITGGDRLPGHPLPHDSSPRDPSPRDSSPRDSSPRDSSPRDSSPRDSSPRDSFPRQPLPSQPLPSQPLPSRDRKGAGPRILNSPCLTPDADGLLRLPEGPGYGVTVDVESIRPYLVDCEIKVAGKVLYRTPELGNHT